MPMPTFAADIRQWKTVQEFANHLSAYNPAIAPWANGVVVHHTYIPTQASWNGRTSMDGLKSFYISKQWTAGPHLFIVANSANPNNDGIWQLTPLNMQGVHAGTCNAHTWGIEVVGDYNTNPWDAQTRDLVVGAAAELLKWRSITVSPTTVKGHRDCNSPKTCPGTAINLNDVRQWITTYLTPPAPNPLISKQSAIIAPPRCTIEQAAAYIRNRTPQPLYTSYDITVNILPWYWQHGAQTGVDPCIAVAQMIHETANMSSWWSDRPRRNPAGIGVTGEKRSSTPPADESHQWAWHATEQKWHKGLSFPSWIESAKAQVGRLCAYATLPANRSASQTALVNAAMAYRSLPAAFHGVAPTLEGLNGRWSASTTYADKIAQIANAMVATQV
jgi:hypothetical protein